MSYTYQGVKFTVKATSKEIPQDSRLDELKYWCNIFHKYNLAPPYKGGSYGNLSFRLKDNEDAFIITGSKVGLKNKLSNDLFVAVLSCDLQDRIVYKCGAQKPSSESMMHFAIYHKRKEINAIFHGHCEKVLACAEKLKLPETPREEPYGTIEAVNSVLDVLDGKNFLVMKNHGFITLGKSMEEAGELTLKIHEMCK